jgi:hypothetical protein
MLGDEITLLMRSYVMIMAGRAPDDFDIVSAIWILSCNDENPIITYKGIADRLGLPDTYDVRALVRRYRELFRPGVLNSRLEAWKERMLDGKSQPGWITEIKDAAAQAKAIADLTRDDVFRNQFRVEENAPKCDIKIIDWGLNHIDRLRKSAAEEREARVKTWSSIVIPFLSVLLALLSVSSTVWLQRKSIEEQSDLKRYEVSFKPKQEAYSKFMSAISAAALSAVAQEKENLLSQLSEAEQAYFLFEPFLKDDLRKDIIKKTSEFGTLCVERSRLNVAEGSIENRNYLQKVGEYKANFQNLLYSSLFGSVKYDGKFAANANLLHV